MNSSLLKPGDLEPTLGFRYFTCRWGEVVPVPDADNDGIPDDTPFLPLDEKRFGSDPPSKIPTPTAEAIRWKLWRAAGSNSASICASESESAS